MPRCLLQARHRFLLATPASLVGNGTDGEALPDLGHDAMTEQALADGFSLSALTASFLDDPYPVYRALQRLAPCKRMANGQYFLTRYDDLNAIYRDTTRFSSDKTVEFLPKYGDSPL